MAAAAVSGGRLVCPPLTVGGEFDGSSERCCAMWKKPPLPRPWARPPRLCSAPLPFNASCADYNLSHSLFIIYLSFFSPRLLQAAALLTDPVALLADTFVPCVCVHACVFARAVSAHAINHEASNDRKCLISIYSFHLFYIKSRALGWPLFVRVASAALRMGR